MKIALASVQRSVKKNKKRGRNKTAKCAQLTPERSGCATA